MNRMGWFRNKLGEQGQRASTSRMPTFLTNSPFGADMLPKISRVYNPEYLACSQLFGILPTTCNTLKHPNYSHVWQSLINEHTHKHQT